MRPLHLSAWSLVSALVPLTRADLRGDLTGKGFDVVFPGSTRFTQASSPFNLRLDNVEPVAVAYPTTPQQVSQIVQAGAQNNIAVVARGGGHSYIANGIGGTSGHLVFDMSSFKTLSVDSNTKIATIGTGNRLGDVAIALNNQGRAMPHGTCPTVGIGGHSGYGGFGFTSRMWGLTLDTIDSLDVVLANGTLATASASSYPDLFWGLRGSSGSFGIVTQIRARTFQAPASATVFQYIYSLTATEAAAALGAFQDFTRRPDLPAQWGGGITMGNGGNGKLYFQFGGGWYGPANQLRAVIQPFLNAVPKQPQETLTSGNYLKSVQTLAGEPLQGPQGTDTFYARSLNLPNSPGFTDAARLAFTTYLANNLNANTNWFVQVELYGGANSAISAVPLDATAFGRRGAFLNFQLYTSSNNGQPPFPQQGFTLVDGMVNSVINNTPGGTDIGAYANYIEANLFDWQHKYYSTNYPRLQTLKQQYDPNNVFRFPTSIEL